jgi:hypothetical protein
MKSVCGVVLACVAAVQGCTTVIVGKDASIDGSVRVRGLCVVCCCAVLLVQSCQMLPSPPLPSSSSLNHRRHHTPQVMATHSDDGGAGPDARLLLTPAANHPPNSHRPIYYDLEDYPHEPQQGQVPIGYIPEVNHTFAR